MIGGKFHIINIVINRHMPDFFKKQCRFSKKTGDFTGENVSSPLAFPQPVEKRK